MPNLVVWLLVGVVLVAVVVAVTVTVAALVTGVCAGAAAAASGALGFFSGLDACDSGCCTVKAGLLILEASSALEELTMPVTRLGCMDVGSGVSADDALRA